MHQINYYLKDEDGNIVVSVCVVKDDNGIYKRGIAICSKHDNPVKNFGRRLALKRALNAQKYSLRENNILDYSTYNRLAKKLMVEHDRFDPKILNFKSAYDCQLTEYEKYLFERYQHVLVAS